MEFLAMGGYGFYVWGSYGVTALAVRARRRRARDEARLTTPDALSAATGGTL
jgi:heme exporter protein CcmD